MTDDGVGDILPGSPEGEGCMPQVRGGPGGRVTDDAPTVPVWDWWGTTVAENPASDGP